MKPTVWHVMIAVLLIAYVFGAAAIIAYVLYGPGFEIKVPELFGLNSATSTQESMSSEAGTPAPVPAPDLLLGYPGTLFECEGDKALKAEFSDGRVRLALSDGRQLSLPETTSENGARYANTNESFVFWNGNDAAFVEENNIMTYANCAVRS